MCCTTALGRRTDSFELVSARGEVRLFITATAYVSVRERTTKARMAFLLGPMARVGARCIKLDGPALVTGDCLSVLVIQAATGVSRALVVRA